MKSLLILIFVICLFNINRVSCQSWLNTNNRWYIQYNCTGSEPFGGREVRAYFLSDTLFSDGQIYLQMYETTDTNFLDIVPTGYWYREENQKVYLRFFEGNIQERLVYDFNLDIGDTLTLDDGSGAFNIRIKVILIDSVYLTNGNRRKRLTLKNDADPDDHRLVTWIEGVGSDLETLDPSRIFISDCQSSLNCFYQLNSFPAFQPCKFIEIVKVNKIPTLAGLNVFPNPFTTALYLDAVLPKDFPLTADYSVSVFDIQGKEMYHEKARWVNNLHIETATWHSGLYVLVIRSANSVLSRKLIKM